MSEDDLLVQLNAVDGVTARADEPMHRHTPLRIGGPADIYAEMRDVQAIKQGLALVRAAGIRKWTVHWPEQATLIRDTGMTGLVVRPGAGFHGLDIDDDGLVKLGAATPFSALAGLGPQWAGIASWPGCAGGLFAIEQQEWLAGAITGLAFARGRGAKTVAIEPGAAPENLGPSDVLMWVRLRPSPVSPHGTTRVRPPRAGEIFAEPGVQECPGGLAAELVKLDLPGTRLRAWRLNSHRVGEVEQLGGGTHTDLMHLVKAMEDRLLRGRGLELNLGLPSAGRSASAASKRAARRRS